MPKSRKRRQKPANRQTRPTRSALRSSSLPPIVGDFTFSRSLGMGQATDEDWEQLRSAFLRQHPVCPDCEAPWDLESAGEEEGVGFDGKAEITLSVMCSNYADDLDANREPRPHRRHTNEGVIEYSMSHDEAGRIVYWSVLPGNHQTGQEWGVFAVATNPDVPDLWLARLAHHGPMVAESRTCVR